MLAAASLALATGASPMHAALLGNAAAAIEIAKLGNIPVAAHDLRQWVDERAELAAPRPNPALSSWPPPPKVAPNPVAGSAASNSSDYGVQLSDVMHTSEASSHSSP